MNNTSDIHGCSWTRERIDAYIDADLSGNERGRFEEHVGRCAECKDELSLASTMLSELRALPSQPCPPQVVDRVFNEIPGAADVADGPMEERGSFVSRWLFAPRLRALRPVLVSVFVVVVAASALFVGRVSRTPAPPTTEEVEHAEAALKWTLAYVNNVSRRTGLAVRDEAIGVGIIQPVRRAVHTVVDEDASKPEEQNGG
jgi:anti-sigma factor RsiW